MEILHSNVSLLGRMTKGHAFCYLSPGSDASSYAYMKGVQGKGYGSRSDTRGLNVGGGGGGGGRGAQAAALKVLDIPLLLVLQMAV